MIIFQPMRDDEFSEFRSCFISDYTREIVENYKISTEAAAVQVSSELASDLPDGPATHGQFLLCIHQKNNGVNTHIGYIWDSRKQHADQIFICDFPVLPPYQGPRAGQVDTGLAGFASCKSRCQANQVESGS